jgi:hypothetical protein
LKPAIISLYTDPHLKGSVLWRRTRS